MRCCGRRRRWRHGLKIQERESYPAMKLEVRQASEAPKSQGRSKYNEVLAAFRKLRESEALFLALSGGEKANNIRTGVQQQMKREGITNFLLATEPDGSGVWLLRKGANLTPAAPEQNGRTAVPFGGAPVAVGR